MLKFEDAFIDFSNMGLFMGGENWIHPKTANKTHELIFVVKGEVFLREGDRNFCLKAGDIVCLKPETVHEGYKKSDGASFFWIHFYAENYPRFGVYEKTVSAVYEYAALLKNLNHLAKIRADKILIESKLLAFLAELKFGGCKDDKLFHDVSEYIRINACYAPKVKAVAENFGYNADYLSRLFIKNCGLSLKKFIDKERLAYVSDRLLNTALSLKEIAAECGFEDDNALIKFFTARKGVPPVRYKNRVFATHLNSK